MSEFEQKLTPKLDSPAKRVNRSPYLTQRNVDYRWKILNNPDAQAELFDTHTESQMQAYEKT
ncbi:hydroxymethylglutaryl-CoA reductase [Vibrio maritimus]|uniref:Hydroxymethylglutaryl-CoA reductase n=1 Tax=Vibrio maritimus TaxID=990268 RepID=A0A090SX45_9VIBR|nr:hydroxymethylglutaryl-CoA reductase [Vibrio maritimus]